MDTSHKQIALKIIFIGLFLFTSIRLFTSMVTFGRESLQLDFSAFYTAGQSLNHGLPVYENNIVHTPPVWDGAAFFKHSRFLYPPLVATLFRPWALLPYKIAKHFWMFFNLLCIGIAMLITANILQIKRSMANYLIVGISIGLFHPTFIYLERGQIDAVVLVLILFSVKLGTKDNTSKFTAGLILAIASLLKLYCILIIPFLIVKKRWKPLQGYIIGLSLLLLLSFLFNGTESTIKYFTQEMPRIAKYGEDGPRDMMLPKNIVKRRRAVPAEKTSKDGVNYSMTTLKFIDNATIVRNARLVLNKYGIDVSRSIVSVLLFSGFFLIIALWQRQLRRYSESENPLVEFVYWQIVLIVVLLTSPLTWVMNTVWLLPVVIILLHQSQFIKSKERAFYFSIGTIGLIIAAIPDRFIHIVPSFDSSGLMNGKYIFSEMILFLALMGLLASICTSRDLPKEK